MKEPIKLESSMKKLLPSDHALELVLPDGEHVFLTYGEVVELYKMWDSSPLVRAKVGRHG